MRIKELYNINSFELDDEDKLFISSFYFLIHKTGYIVVKIKKQSIYLHHLIAERILERPLQPKERIYFIDKNKLNISRSNLKITKISNEITNDIFILDKIAMMPFPKRKYKSNLCNICKINIIKRKHYCNDCKIIKSRETRRRHKKLFKINHQEKYLAQRRKLRANYRKNNSDKVKAQSHIRRAREINAEGKFTATEWKLVKDNQGNKCLFCKQECKLTVDHIIPLSKGGTNWISNIQGLCMSCNASKKDRIITELTNL